MTQLVRASHQLVNAPANAELKPGRLVAASATELPVLTDVLEERRISTVFHLAAMNTNRGTEVSPYQLFEANVRGTYTVLEACRVATTTPRVVVLSSREAEHCFDPCREDAIHPYAASKAAAELIATSFAETFGLNVVSLRAANIYGAGDLNWNRLVPSAIRAFLMGKSPVIGGSLHVRRDYIHVADVIEACLAAATHAERLGGAERTIPISTGLRTTTAEMLHKIAAETGRCDLVPTAVEQIGPTAGDSRPVHLHDADALGWTSTVSLDHGLAKTIKWYRRYLCRTQSE